MAITKPFTHALSNTKACKSCLDIPWYVVLCLLLLYFQHVFAQDDISKPDSKWLITSPQACISANECPPGFYCTGYSVTPNYRCLRRGSDNAPCPGVGIGSCQSGLYCENLVPSKRCRQFFPTGAPCARCKKQRAIGMSCALDDQEPCIGRALCDHISQKCSLRGFSGDSCRMDMDCQKALGLTCDFTRCVQRSPIGAQCSPEGCANGFCSGGYEAISGKCIAYRREGQLCNQVSQCARPNVTTPFDDRLLCNSQSTVAGICVRASRLITRLGAPCNPNEDRCDARRDLRCLWANSVRRFVCQQRGTGNYETFCTPGNPFSKCEVTPRYVGQCRRDRSVDGKISGFYMCRTPLVTVRRGSVCNLRGNTVCESGTSCEVVPGITNDARFGGPPELARVCVQIKGEGEDCQDKFWSACKKGLICVNGKCRTGQPTRSENITHASYYNSCSNLPCMPGSVCELLTPQSVDPVCLPPREVVKAGESCFSYDFVRKECPVGLLCLSDRQGQGQFRCRKPQGVGDVCSVDDDCAKNLKCGPESIEGPSSPRYCYNITTALRIGASCNPKDSLIEGRCIGTLFTGGDGPTFGLPLQCLPKGSGFACQRPFSLFQYCSETNNVACREEIAECRNGVCLPRSNN